MAAAQSPALADALLDAHVAWTLSRLEGDALQTELESQVDQFLGTLDKLKLKDVVRTKDIQAVALKYAAHLNLGPVIPELVGDVARSIYSHRIHSQTRLQDVVPDRMVEEVLDKILEMKTLRETLAKHTVSNPVFANLIAELLQSAIRDYVKRGTEMSNRIPGARSAMKIGRNLVERTRPDLGERLDDNLRQFIQRQTEASLVASERFLLRAVESDELRDALLDAWHGNKHHTVASARDFAGTLDIEELFVIGYEYWQKFRRTPLFTELVESGVETVLKRLGPMKISAILDEIGVSREMILEDAQRFAPPVIAALKKKKLLEPIVRAQLAGFYASAEFQDVLKAQQST